MLQHIKKQMEKQLNKGHFTIHERKEIQKLLSEGNSLQLISIITGVSIPKIRSEVKRGLGFEDYSLKKYVKYDIALALKNLIIEKVGEDNFLFFIENYQYNDNKEKN